MDGSRAAGGNPLSRHLPERVPRLRGAGCGAHPPNSHPACRPPRRHSACTTAPITRDDFNDPARPVPISIVGAHGGAGTTTVARLLNATDAARQWPSPDSPGHPLRVLLTARTNAAGLMAASRALAGYCAAAHADGPYLAGLVLVPDVPGRLPKALKRRISILASAVMIYRMPWVRSWRMCELTPSRDTAVHVATGLMEFAERAALSTSPTISGPRTDSLCARS